jgi:hypothetical protein
MPRAAFSKGLPAACEIIYSVTIMTASDMPLAKFTISENAKLGIETVKQTYGPHSPDPPAVPCIGWGRWQPFDGNPSENVVIGFYLQSQVASVASGVQRISGLDVLFFAGREDLPKFEGKVLDFESERGFFLRDPE